MEDLLSKYLNLNFSLKPYLYLSDFPPRDGFLLYDKLSNREISWANFNKELALIFSLTLYDAKYYVKKWFDNEVKHQLMK